MTPGSKTATPGPLFLFFFHLAVLFIGFSILAIVFDFPVVLRESSQYRLTLYSANQSLIQPALWLLAVAGLTQIALSVILYRYLRNHRKILQKIAVPFGVLAGLLQAISFFVWAAPPPWLGVSSANICLGLWTILTGASMFGQHLFDRKIGAFGVAAGCVVVFVTLELFGVAPALFEVIVNYGFPAWAVWLVVVAVSLLKTDPATGEGPLYGWRSFSWSACLYLLLILPKLLG